MGFERSVHDDVIVYRNNDFYIAVSRCEIVYPLETISEEYGVSHMKFAAVQEAELFDEPASALYGFSFRPKAAMAVYRLEDTEAIVCAWGNGKRVIGILNDLMAKAEAIPLMPSSIFVKSSAALPPVAEAMRFYSQYKNADARARSRALYENFLQKTPAGHKAARFLT